MVTLGTGVGGGVISGGEIFYGSSGHACEMGHLIVVPHGRKCHCGQHGCLEQYSSARSLLRDARMAMPGHTIKDAKELFDFVKSGDTHAIDVVDRAAEHLATACVNLSRLFDTQRIIFGGGLSNAGDLLLDRIRLHYSELHRALQ